MNCIPPAMVRKYYLRRNRSTLHFRTNIGSGRPSGYTKAAVVNTAIDERFAIFSSAVITASEREAISMIDLLLGNPVVKSTIHSTDTHGSTEVIFGIMQLLGITLLQELKMLALCYCMVLKIGKNMKP